MDRDDDEESWYDDYRDFSDDEIRSASTASSSVSEDAGKITSTVRTVINSPYTELATGIVILANCVTLALDEPGNDIDNLSKFEVAFTLIFAVEMMLKMASQGLIVSKNAYLRSWWNVVDFSIVVMNIVSFFIFDANVSAFRVLRVFKALLVIDRMPGLKLMILATIHSLKNLASLGLLLIFILVINGIWGVQLWSGQWKYNCLDEDRNVESVAGSCQLDNATSFFMTGHTCSAENGFICSDIGNPYYGFASFDNFGAAFLLVVQCVTLTGWSEMMYRSENSSGILAVPFFINLVTICSYVILPLTVIIIKDALQEFAGDAFYRKQKEFAVTRLKKRLRHKNSNDDTSPSARQAVNEMFEEYENEDRAVQISNMVVPFIIIVNFIVMCMQHYGQQNALDLVIAIVNIATTAIFSLEIGYKVAIMRWTYFRDGFNVLDFISVLSSLIDISLSAVFPMSTGTLTCFRVFRLVRVIRALRASDSIKRQVEGALAVCRRSGYLFLLVLIYIFILALTCMHVFGERMMPPYRDAFYSFKNSVLTALQLVTGDRWGGIMYSAMAATHEAVCIPFIICHFMGDIVLIRLFLAVIMDYYELMNQQQHFPTQNRKRAASRKRRNVREAETMNQILNCNNTAAGTSLVDHRSVAVPEEYLNAPDLYDAYMKGLTYKLHPVGDQTITRVRANTIKTAYRQGNEAAATLSGGTQCILGFAADSAARKIVSKMASKTAKVNINGKSWFLFDGEIRRICISVAGSPRFEKVAVILSWLSCVVVGLEDIYKVKIFIADYCITAVFTLEFLVKSIASGFILGEDTYMKHGWNVFDLTILIAVWVSYITQSLQGHLFRIFRSLRAVRPLRLVKRWRSVRLTAEALVACLPGLATILVVLSLVFVAFGTTGVDILGGKLFTCTAPMILRKEDCYGIHFVDKNETSLWTYGVPYAVVVNESTDGYSVKGEWVQSPQHFDHIGGAVRYLVTLSTFDNWRQAFDIFSSSCSDSASYLNNCTNVSAAIFLIAFLFVVNSLLMPIVTAEVVITYLSVRRNLEHTTYFSDRSLSFFYQMKLLLLLIKPAVHLRPRNSKLAIWCYKVVNHRYFDNTIGLLIVVNVVLMAMEYQGMPASLSWFLVFFDYVFTILFLLEALLKVNALGLSYYKDTWNRFDFLLVMASVSEILLFLLMGSSSVPINPFILRVCRAFLRLRKAQRLLRLVKRTRGIQLLFETLLVSLSSLWANTFFFVTILAVYALGGVALFDGIQKNGIGLTKDANFDNLYMATRTLYRVATGDTWSDILVNCMVAHPYCEGDSCGFPIIAPLYFFTFKAFSYILLVTLFIATVIENYRAMSKLDGLTDEMAAIRKFHEAWSVLYSSTTVIPTDELPRILVEMTRLSDGFAPDFSLPINYKSGDIFKVFSQFRILDNRGKVHFTAILLEIAYHTICKNTSMEDASRREWWSFEYTWYSLLPELKMPVTRLRWYRYTVNDYFACVFIQKWYRFILRIRRLRDLLLRPFLRDIGRGGDGDQERWHPLHPPVPPALHRSHKRPAKPEKLDAFSLEKGDDLHASERRVTVPVEEQMIPLSRTVSTTRLASPTLIFRQQQQNQSVSIASLSTPLLTPLDASPLFHSLLSSSASPQSNEVEL